MFSFVFDINTIFISVCVFGGAGSEDNLQELSSLLPGGCWDSTPGHQSWQQVPSSAEPSQSPYFGHLIKFSKAVLPFFLPFSILVSWIILVEN